MPENINPAAEDVRDAAKDYIDERNYMYNELAGCRAGAVKDFVFLNDGIIQSQSVEGYWNGCVYYASSMHDNYCNMRDSIADRSTGAQLCDASDTRDPNTGDYVINGPKTLQKLDMIEGYFQVADSEMKEVLSKGMPIHTGSNTINRRKTLKSLSGPNNDNIAVIGTGNGHAFHIIGYNETGATVEQDGYTIPNNCWICKDSATTGDNGMFYVRFEDTARAFFYSKFVFTNKLDDVEKYKQQVRAGISLDSAKAFYDRGYTNGERPQEYITREECWALLERILVKNNLQ